MLSVVIPLFNEVECLPQLYKRLTDAAPSWHENYEVVLVDDGSSDGSPDMMLDLVRRDGHFRLVKLSRNFGHQAAISAGIAHARGDAVVIMDGDLQDPPEELPRFLEKWRDGYDIVYAIRTNRKESWPKRAAYAVFYRFLSLISELEIPLDSGDFCLMDRKVVEVLKHNFQENIRFVRGLRAYAGFRQIGVRYERQARAAGEVKYTFFRLLKLAADGIFGFSILPLRIATWLGMFISLISFCLGIFFIVMRLTQYSVIWDDPEQIPGLASLAVGIFFLGGIILVFLGILGEYIGRIYMEVKRRPAYIVEAVHDSMGLAHSPVQVAVATRQ